MEKLGIDTNMIIVQIVNFTLLFIILRKYLSKPILQAIKKRESDLKRIDDNKAEIVESKKKAQEEYSKIIASAKNEAEEILNSARSDAEQQKRDILESANVQAKKIVSKAKLQKKVKK